MKKIITYLLVIFFTKSVSAQNPGLIISEVFVNPTGTDSCKEYVELIAAQNINFNTTPYTIIVNNNGAATTSGWIAGGGLSYAFAITSGSVSQGQVVYVGGSCMTPTVNQIRVINVKNVNGDGGIGLANASGVFGNGGANADGVAVFNLPVASIAASTVPTDALFWGTGIGTASVSAIDGYQLPVNDLYAGGKLSGSSFYTSDPGGDIITAMGVYNISNNSWGIPRTFSITPFASITSASSVSLTVNASPATISFLSNDTTVVESAGTCTVYARLTGTSSSITSASITLSNWSTATSSDYTLLTPTISFPANAPLNSLAPIVISINDDASAENAEYLLLKFNNTSNANLGTTTLCAVYIKDNDKTAPAPSNALSLNLLSSFSNSVSGSNSAEIVAHDPSTQRLYIANSVGNKLDIVNFINPSNPVLLSSISMAAYGNINSLAVRNGTIACAVENITNPQDTGKVVFFDKDGMFLKDVKVGAMPDMVTFNHAGTRVITANEGEPNAAYTNDPDGSVSIINISAGVTNLNQSNVTAITFTSYNGTEATLKSQGIRIFGVSGIASKDFEPEYVSVSPDDTKAWVTLQENNAVVEVNLLNNTISSLKSLGTKDFSQTGNGGADMSNLTRGINIANFPVKGFYMPDAIASYSVAGNTYYITANEGDARAYTGLNEEQRVSAMNLDPIKFPNPADLKNNYVLGRLQCTNKSGDSDNDLDIDTIYCYGSRSFSIWNATNGNLVYDSKDDLEQITAANSYSVLFNASNTTATAKDRSDDKGPEPEGVAIGKIGSATYAFIALERIGGVMVYDVTNPNNPVYVTYANNRSALTNGPDRGAEGIIFIPQSQSPNGQHIVIAANEVSSTLSIWGIPGCATPLASVLSVSGNTVNVCANQGPVLSVPANAGASYQWFNGSNPVAGATSSAFIPAQSGNFNVSIAAGSNCSVTSLSQSVSLLALPSVTLGTSAATICVGQSASLTANGATSYTWSTGVTSVSTAISPTVTTVYTLSATGSNGCISGSNTITQAVSPCTAIEQNALSNSDLAIYPNPATHEITIVPPTNEAFRLNMYDAQGRLVHEEKAEGSPLKLNVSGLNKGIYMVFVQTGSAIFTKKIIIH